MGSGHPDRLSGAVNTARACLDGATSPRVSASVKMPAQLSASLPVVSSAEHGGGRECSRVFRSAATRTSGRGGRGRYRGCPWCRRGRRATSCRSAAVHGGPTTEWRPSRGCTPSGTTSRVHFFEQGQNSTRCLVVRSVEGGCKGRQCEESCGALQASRSQGRCNIALELAYTTFTPVSRGLSSYECQHTAAERHCIVLAGVNYTRLQKSLTSLDSQ